MNRLYPAPTPFRETTMYLPSGVHVGDTKVRDSSRVSGRALLPSAFINQRLSDPLRSLTKAMVLPSGEYAGNPSKACPLVRRVAFPPAIGNEYRSPMRSKRIVWPSG